MFNVLPIFITIGNSWKTALPRASVSVSLGIHLFLFDCRMTGRCDRMLYLVFVSEQVLFLRFLTGRQTWSVGTLDAGWGRLRYSLGMSRTLRLDRAWATNDRSISIALLRWKRTRTVSGRCQSLPPVCTASRPVRTLFAAVFSFRFQWRNLLFLAHRSYFVCSDKFWGIFEEIILLSGNLNLLLMFNGLCSFWMC